MKNYFQKKNIYRIDAFENTFAAVQHEMQLNTQIFE